MRVSSLITTVATGKVGGKMNPYRVETRSDAIAIISNDFHLRNYIEQFGDVVLEYNEAANIYRVPEFAGVIARYNEAKTRDCQRWGCE